MLPNKVLGISNQLLAFIAAEVSSFYANDEINLLFQSSGFDGSEKRHWTRLGRAQAWLTELRIDNRAAIKLHALTIALSKEAASRSVGYQKFLTEFRAMLESEFIVNDDVKQIFGLLGNPLPKEKKIASKKDGDLKSKTKRHKNPPTQALALSKDSLIVFQELLLNSTSQESNKLSTNKIILPIDKATYDQIANELEASILLLSTPKTPKRIIDYLKEFRKLLVELKAIVTAGSGIAGATLLFLAALEKTIEALSHLLTR